MIGQRPELKFANLRASEESITFDLVCGSARAADVEYRFADDTPEVLNGGSVRCGEKIIKLLKSRNPDSQILRWFTPDRILFEHWRGDIHLGNLSDVGQFTVFDLHYVGISTAGDSFSRLFNTGHKARAKILSNARQKQLTSRVADEVFLFLFKVNDLIVKSYEKAEDFDTDPVGDSLDPNRLAADAEKAFIKVLRSEYNERQYPNYPCGKDGLYGLGLNGYGYFIRDKITLRTEHAMLRGADLFELRAVNEPDAIWVNGDEITVFRR